MRRAASCDGFTVIELLVSAAIGLLVTAAVCTLLTSGQLLAQTETERANMLQRLRVGADVLSASIRAAGAGPDGGAAPGALSRRFAPILPRRIGRLRADGEGVFRADAITTVSVAPDAIPATLAFALSPGSSDLYVDESFCGSGSACGISAGDTIAVFDRYGRFDLLSVVLVDGSRVQFRHCGGGLMAEYSRGTPVVAVDAATHYLDRAANQLRRYDADASDLPAIDDVVDLRFEYVGDVEPPRSPGAAPGEANCLYDSAGRYNTSAMPRLAGAQRLVPLASSQLVDGPWCGAPSTLYDADLLRVRAVRITLRLQTSDAVMRGADAVRFRNPGPAQHSGRQVPDLTLVFDVIPRNMGFQP